MNLSYVDFVAFGAFLALWLAFLFMRDDASALPRTTFSRAEA